MEGVKYFVCMVCILLSVIKDLPCGRLKEKKLQNHSHRLNGQHLQLTYILRWRENEALMGLIYPNPQLQVLRWIALIATCPHLKVSRFNADAGWGGVDGGIEIPLDVNKQPLIWVNSEVNEDGSILVKTYHRTHPNAPKFARNDIDDFNDGDPIDIPAGRFISVRVQMPEGSIYNVRMREMEEAQKAEEERRQKEDERLILLR